MAPQSWSISPRRLENLVILLLLAASLPPVATYAVWNATERPTLPRVLALAPAPGPSHLPPWLRSAGLCAVWLAANVGTVIPILVLSAALLRFVSVRLTLWLVVAYQCAAAVALSMDAVGELRTLPAAFSLAFPGGYWLTVFRRLLSELASCVLPLALLTCWLGGSSRSTGRADSGGCLESPAARAARLTVVTLLVSGAVLLMHGTLQLVVHGLILLHPPVELGTDRLALLADTVLTAAWGILLLVCGLRFERGRRIAPGWLWVALAVNFAGAAAVGATSLAWLYLEGVHDLLTPTRFVRLCLRTFVDIAASWPVVAALLWFWWPALACRAAVDLRDHAAVCQRCGYSLVGNVSGRCPECGLTAT